MEDEERRKMGTKIYGKEYEWQNNQMEDEKTRTVGTKLYGKKYEEIN